MIETDKQKFIKLLKKWNLPSKEWTDKRYIADQAIRAGTETTLSLRDYVDFCFDKKGKFVGSYTQCAGSWLPKRKKRNKNAKPKKPRRSKTKV